MRNKFGRWLTGTVIHALGGRYEGIIATVTEEIVPDKWTAPRPQIVVTFEDQKAVVIQPAVWAALLEHFGPESDAWIGRRLVWTAEGHDVTSKAGKVTTRWEKALAWDDAPAVVTVDKPITRKQQELLLGVAKIHGVTPDRLVGYLAHVGIAAVAVIPRDRYAAIEEAVSLGLSPSNSLEGGD